MTTDHKDWVMLNSVNSSAGASREEDPILIQDGNGPIDILAVEPQEAAARNHASCKLQEACANGTFMTEVEGASNDKTFEPPVNERDPELEPREPTDPAGSAPVGTQGVSVLGIVQGSASNLQDADADYFFAETPDELTMTEYLATDVFDF